MDALCSDLRHHQKGINEMPPSALYVFVLITLIHP